MLDPKIQEAMQQLAAIKIEMHTDNPDREKIDEWIGYIRDVLFIVDKTIKEHSEIIRRLNIEGRIKDF